MFLDTAGQARCAGRLFRREMAVLIVSSPGLAKPNSEPATDSLMPEHNWHLTEPVAGSCGSRPSGCWQGHHHGPVALRGG